MVLMTLLFNVYRAINHMHVNQLINQNL